MQIFIGNNKIKLQIVVLRFKNKVYKYPWECWQI